VTSVGENEEKINTIKPPFLVFFSPSNATCIVLSVDPREMRGCDVSIRAMCEQ